MPTIQQSRIGARVTSITISVTFSPAVYQSMPYSRKPSTPHIITASTRFLMEIIPCSIFPLSVKLFGMINSKGASSSFSDAKKSLPFYIV